MAGALAVVLAVYWKFKLTGCDDLDHEEDDLEVPTLDAILETEDMENSDEEEEEEEEIFGTEELYSVEEEEEEEEEEIFESEILDSSDEEEEIELEDNNQEPQLLRQHPEQLDEEKQMSAKELEISQVHRGLQLEHLLDEAKKEIVWLQNQILDKDLLLEKKGAEGTELRREIEHLNIEKEQLQAEKRKLEDDYELAVVRGDGMETLQKELMNNIASLENQLKEKDHLLRKRDDDERKLQSVFQQTMVEKDRELESAFEKANELNLRLNEIAANNQALATERDSFKRTNEEKERKVNHQQELLVRRAIEAEKDQLHLGVLENQILDMKEDHMALQRQLELTEGENSRLEDRNCELKKNLANETQRNISLQKECERLREKCRMEEEKTIKEQNRVRDHLRMQEEELRNHDKYMLMALLHGTAQRNFLLEHIALDCRNKSLDNNSKEEKPHNCVETAEGKDQGQEEDRYEQVRKVEEEQYRMYHNAQQEKDDYGKQWEDLTQMVEDVIQGDERKDC
ncbi:trichohyalin-like [Macrobrachium rosenbergii]|uniref:trichohyalin-like n=1 Tax=Macrobrachium rosenbergii TaxID=79674 RepID=UPI0034D67153